MSIMRLDLAKQLKLDEFMRARFDDIEREKPTQEAFAKQASNALGFRVGPSSLRSWCEAVGKTWPTQKATDARTLKEKVELLEAETLELRDAIAALGKRLNQLEAGLGVETAESVAAP